ncbi:Rne/Rng family ribonuclease [uncultured Maricaulis sp.]|uniref:Rne/Rng family ribonuclease n=1 Tax=uncultured Maricaulis sp. TaxID=174710 RepID=UPI0025DB01E7|nr:Rne/Rng family ribonuclease [uncultured Maricaulis sp.]
MSKKMLIDAGHPEETRVVVLDGSKVEDFDFEAAARRPIRGNIYLAKVTRVEPSLQAAFVEYGGNRHGFLAFNEIHPDYYQIPYEDRVALAEEEASAADEDEDEPEDAKAESAPKSDNASADADPDGDADGESEAPETIGDDSEDDDISDQQAARRRRQMLRRYKIQEVIKRRQILLVQVAKEERGNKGAALTTYLSLAGRYCVLMPNTPRGGGISRKISNASDRKRLKSVVSELELPKGVGLIIRTAGASRTKTEIKRDADYLLRLWTNIRELTLNSVAPSLIYEEGNLVKRVIRDLYDKEIDSVQVEGEEAYKEAKAFMKMLMPSHAKKVQHYKETVPLFLRHQCESQLEAIYSDVAPLKSGGYLVINPTEALVSIDVNSGRSTRERNIEATALKTNLEAAAEAARQMRLRDLAGLIVIDFIDMDENKNNRAVEKKMKDMLKRDRARLQVGRISQFGLMEISRQRRRSSLLEGSTTTCPTCKGTGHLRSTESSALVALRGLEKEGTRGRAKRIRISVPTAVAIYLLNEKRDHLLMIEQRFSMRISVEADDSILAPEFSIEALENREPGEELTMAPLSVESIEEIEIPDTPEEESAESEDENREGGGRRRRRRRRRKSSSEDSNAAMEVVNVEGSDDEAAEASGEESGNRDAQGEDGEDQPRRRRRRGRRGGRGRRRTEGEASTEDNAASAETGESETAETAADAVSEATTDAPKDAPENTPADTPADVPADAAPAEEKPKRKRAPRRKKTETEAPVEAGAEETADVTADAPDEAPAAAEEAPKKRTRRPRKKAAEPAADAATDTPEAETAKSVEDEAPKPKRRTRRKKADEPEAEAAKPAPKPAPKAAPKAAAKTAPKAAAKPAAAAETEKAATESDDTPRETEAADAGTAESDDGKPKRRGWWNRTGLFGN